MSGEALLNACRTGNLDEAKRLLDAGVDVNCKGFDERTPLHLACQNGHVHVAELLLSKGADVNSKDNDGSTLLFMACRSTDPYRLVYVPPPQAALERCFQKIKE